MFITVFTPAYNRANLIPRVFESLKAQTYTYFEWIIVDDGSSDNTEEVVDHFILEDAISVRYEKQQNAGKHIAINKGAKLASGDVFFIVDSDDWLLPNSLEIIANTFSSIKGKGLSGVSFRGAFSDGTQVGDHGEDNLISNAIDVRYKKGLKGDLVELYWTDVIKKYPFPETSKEKFCPEALVWNRISNNYQRLYKNDVVYMIEYQESGLTDKIVKIRMTSPIASMLTYSELASYDIPLIEKGKAAINFWRFSFNSPMSLKKKIRMIGVRNLTLLPFGFLMYLKDLQKLK